MNFRATQKQDAGLAKWQFLRPGWAFLASSADVHVREHKLTLRISLKSKKTVRAIAATFRVGKDPAFLRKNALVSLQLGEESAIK